MGLFSFLSSGGVLGMNARNLLYIKPFNPRKAVAFADDKLKTKAFLSARGIPTAKVYAQISTREQLRAFNFAALPSECVLKPNYGYGGEGIIVLSGRDKHGNFLHGGKRTISIREMTEHIEDILDGKFSVNGRRDTAFFEQLLLPHKSFLPFRPAGLPDIRVVVFNLVPVMAMLRIPTGQSEGKANLHLGGLGIGIDIARGTTTFATQYNKTISELPHGADFRGIAIPHWGEILLICSRIQHITNIGYLAVDLTIDQETGPMLLEVNARAGLSVQIANLAPLRARLERVKGLKVSTPEKGVLLAEQLFGKSPPLKREKHPDTIGLFENIVLLTEQGEMEVAASVDAQSDRTQFAAELAHELLSRKAIELEDAAERLYRARFQLAGKKIQTIIHATNLPEDMPRVILGKRDLQGFLIDPARHTEPVRRTKIRVKTNLFAVDRQLHQIHRELPFLKMLRPLNLLEHREKSRSDAAYEPAFEYPAPSFDIGDVRERIKELKTDASAFGLLLKKRKQELLKRLTMIEHRGSNDAFTKASIELFGQPTPMLLRSAHEAISGRPEEKLKTKKERFSAMQAKEIFEDVLKRYGLHQWDVRIQENLIADCAVGGRHVLLRAAAKFGREHIDALVAHEIETHALTSENGRHQTYMLLQSGGANYLETQEGLAMYWQNMALPKGHEKRFWAPLGVLGLAFALKHGFAEVRQHLESIGYSPEKALTKTISFKRGMGSTARAGAFTKDLVYFRGYLRVQEFVESGGDIARLYPGKIALEDLDLIEELEHLKKPLLLPMKLLEMKRRT